MRVLKSLPSSTAAAISFSPSKAAAGSCSSEEIPRICIYGDYRERVYFQSRCKFWKFWHDLYPPQARFATIPQAMQVAAQCRSRRKPRILEGVLAAFGGYAKNPLRITASRP